MDASSGMVVAAGISSRGILMAAGLVPLVGLLLWAAWSDALSHRIPNRLVFSGTALAVLLHVLLPGGYGFLFLVPGGLGLLGALKGLAIGLLAMLPLYLMRALGAGDVKLMAMVGAFLGPDDILPAVVGAYAVGGLLSFALALRAGAAMQMVRNLGYMVRMTALKLPLPGALVIEPPPQSVGSVPFGVAIALGSTLAMFWVALGGAG